jgi:hypothetical protein
MKNIFSGMGLVTQDYVKGFVMFVLSAVITSLYAVAVTPGFDFSQIDPKGIATIAFISALSYLVKNFFTPTTS